MTSGVPYGPRCMTSPLDLEPAARRMADLVRDLPDEALDLPTPCEDYSVGDLLYASAAGTLSKLPIGSAGQVLKETGGLPAWGADITTGGGGGATAWSTTWFSRPPKSRASSARWQKVTSRRKWRWRSKGSP